MKVLVIGNGFDIAHELPTKYKDFLDFIRKKEETDFFTADIELLLKDNIWIQHFNNISENTGENWIDFETEIARVIESIEKEKMYKSTRAFFSETERKRFSRDVEKNRLAEFARMMYEEYSLRPKNSFSDLRDKLIADLNSVEIVLDKYLRYVLEKQKIEPIAHIQSLQPKAVLSFNYTDTYQRVYDKEGSLNYDYIHGKITARGENAKGRIVLGINEHLNDGEKDTCLEYIEFRKYFQRIFKGTGEKYKDWLQIADENEMLQVLFYGHSIDVTDKDILQALILPDYSYCEFYYHNKEALKQQITNLVKIIGQDELIKRTGGSDARIKFVSIPANN